MKKYEFSLSLAVLALAILACANLTVTNKDEKETAIVHITLPGGDGGTRPLAPGEVYTKFASEGGEYTVKVLPSEAYLKKLKETEQKASDVLKNPTAYSASAISDALHAFFEIPTTIAALAAGTACKGELPDLEEIRATGGNTGEGDIPTVALTIRFDDVNSVWTCN